MIVVCDSTLLIGLAKIEKLKLLKQVFSKVCIPEAVFHEVAERGANKPGSEVIRDARWIETIPIKDRTHIERNADPAIPGSNPALPAKVESWG